MIKICINDTRAAPAPFIHNKMEIPIFFERRAILV